MDQELAQAIVVDKVTSVGLLLGAVFVLWRAFKAANDSLIETLKANNAAVVAKLEALRESFEHGLSTLRGQVDDHERRLDAHERRLDEQGRRIDRHAELVGALGNASGIYSLRLAAEKVAAGHE